MIGIYAHEGGDSFVACMDAGERRKPGVEVLKIWQIACYKVNCACAREAALGHLLRSSPCSHCPHARICLNRINRGALKPWIQAVDAVLRHHSQYALIIASASLVLSKISSAVKLTISPSSVLKRSSGTEPRSASRFFLPFLQ